MNAQRKWAMAVTLVSLFVIAPSVRGADGSVTFGTQWWNQTHREAKFEEFRDIPNGPFLEEFVLLDSLRSGRFALFGQDALQNDQATTLLYRRSRWTAGIEYDRTPHNYSFITRTPFAEIAPGVLVVPDSLQRTIQENPNAATATLSDLLRSSPQFALGFRTDHSRARVKSRLGHGVQLDVIGNRRQRQGTKAYGFSFGFNNALEVTEPIDQTMVQGEARLSYLTKRVALEVAGVVESFQNDVDALIVDNPRRLTDSPTAGPSRGRLDLYPDNRTLRGSLKAGLQLPRRTALTIFLQASQIVQDDRWLPFTINTAILQPDTFALPGTNTEGKVNVLTTDLRLTGSPFARVAGTLRFRRHDYDNKTKQQLLGGQVAYDNTWQPADVETDPIGFTHTTLGADADFTPMSRVTLSGTVEHNRRERTFREVAEDAEMVFIGRARIRPGAGLELMGRYRHGDRELEHFEEGHYQNDAGQFIEQPTLRRFDVGDRKQEQALGEIGWAPSGRIRLSAVYEYLRNHYEDEDLEDSSATQLGLLDDARRTASLEASFDVSDRTELSAAYGWGQVCTNQRSRQSSTGTLALTDSANWSARIKDWFIYLNGQVTWHPIVDRLTITGTYELQRAPSVYRLTNFLATAVDLPTSKYRRQGVGAEAWYRVDPGFALGARWGWEQYDVTDFATENVPLIFPTTGTANAIFLGDSILDYKAHTVGLMVRRSF